MVNIYEIMTGVFVRMTFTAFILPGACLFDVVLDGRSIADGVSYEVHEHSKQVRIIITMEFDPGKLPKQTCYTYSTQT